MLDWIPLGFALSVSQVFLTCMQARKAEPTAVAVSHGDARIDAMSTPKKMYRVSVSVVFLKFHQYPKSVDVDRCSP